MPIKNLLERNAFLIALIVTILIAITSLVSLPKTGLSVIKVKNPDKIAHFVAYFILSLTWFYAVKFNTKSIQQKIIIISLLVLYGTIIEGLQQGLTTYRQGDVYDILANSLGIIIATLTFNKLNNWLNSMLK